MIDASLSLLVDPDARPGAAAVPQGHYDLDCPWHRHDMHQLQYAFEGSIEIEDARGRYLLPHMLAAWIPAGVPHRTSLHRVNSGSILFETESVNAAGDHIRIIAVTPLMRAMVIGAMRWPIGAPQDETARTYFRALSALCNEWVAQEAPLSLPTTTDPRLAAALGFVQANLTGTIDACCHAVHMSERTLRRRCRKILGMTWEDYRRRARLIAAAALLNDTTLPIGAIAARVGFESQGAFSSTFKAAIGDTPRAFRNR